MIHEHSGLRIALVGCGTWGVLILRDLKLLGATVTVVARSAATRERAQANGADSVVDSIKALPDKIDGAIVATRSDSHGPVIVELASLRVPIFTEKPLASTVAAAQSAIAACPGRVFVMDKWRYHPGIERLRRMIAEGDLGTPLGISTVRLGWSMTHFELDPIWNLLPHDLSIVDHILGFVPAPVVGVADPLGPLGGGLHAFLGRAPDPLVSIHVSAFHPTNRRSVIVSGASGVATLAGSYEQQLLVRKGKPGSRNAEEQTVPAPGPLPLLAELDCFLRYLRGGPRPFAPAEESLRIVETIVQLRELAGIGEPTDQPWFQSE